MLAARSVTIPPRAPKPRSRRPRVESPSPSWTRGPEILPPVYHPSQHDTWRRLIRVQAEMAPRYVCAEYLQARKLLNLDESSIPALRELDGELRACSGWGLIKARGYVQPRAFFQLLKQKLFPCNDLIRHHTELD
ncbi:MAG: hypothetical protein ACXU86_02905, partial [Archangium sp.]